MCLISSFHLESIPKVVQTALISLKTQKSVLEKEYLCRTTKISNGNQKPSLFWLIWFVESAPLCFNNLSKYFCV